MKKEKLSVRQLAVAAFTGGLSSAAAAAGHGWQGVALALPAVLLAGWAVTALAPRWAGTEKKAGDWVLRACYGFWGFALLSEGLYRCAGRLGTTGGAGGELLPWLVVLLAAPLAWAVRSSPAAFFRAAEVCYLAVGAVAAALLIWGAARVRWENLVMPAESLWGGWLGAAETGGTFLFVLPYINKDNGKERGRLLGWLAALSAAAVLFAVVTAGVLSPALLPLTEEPFFTMTAVLGRSVRVEGLASALWLLADLVRLGLLARSWHWSGSRKSWGPTAAVIAAGGAACLGLPGYFSEGVWALGTAALWGITAITLWFKGENSGRRK